MNRRGFLLDKLAEEAAEVAQAAIKHKHKNTRKSKIRLAQEIGDLCALMHMACDDGHFDRTPAAYSQENRRKRTISKIKELSR